MAIHLDTAGLKPRYRVYFRGKAALYEGDMYCKDGTGSLLIINKDYFEFYMDRVDHPENPTILGYYSKELGRIVIF